MLKLLRQNKTARSLLAATAGFLVYGSWALFINYEYGFAASLKAGLTQGGYSFILTLGLSFMMEWLFQLSRQPIRQFNLTFITTCLLIYATSWSINVLSGTPEILLTILPGAIASTLYTLSYTMALFKVQQA